jgi:hypothetical protein
MASTLKRISRSMPAMPIADSSAPIVVGISVTNSATRINTPICPARILHEAGNGRDGEDEDQRHARQQDRQCDLVGRLLPLRALDQRDHAIEKGRTLGSGDADDDPVRQHARATGHRRPVAAASRITGADSR